MKAQNLNSASRRTELKIKQAFARLIQEKGSTASIAVSELAERAGVTRSTFYAHYHNVAEVGSSFRTEILDEFFKDFKTIETLQDIDDFFDRITIYLHQHEEIYQMLIASDDAYRFMAHLTEKITRSLRQALEHYSNVDNSLSIDFFVNGAISLIIKYFQGNSNFSLDQISIYLKGMFRKIFLRPPHRQ